MSLLKHAKQHRCAVGDADLLVYELGASQAPPLLLLHGGLGSSHDWDRVLDGLSQSFHLWCLDFRGHGRSAIGSKPLSYAQYAADVCGVLDGLGLEAVHIVGFSDGGIAAYRLAMQRPERIQSVVAVGAQWRLLANDPSIVFLQGLTRERWFQMFPQAEAAYLAENPDPDFDRLLESVKALWLDRTEEGYPQNLICQVQAPVLQIRGDDDHMLSLQDALALQEVLPHAHFWNQPFAGHAVQDDATQMFLHVVTEFLLSPSKRLVD